MCFMEHIGMLQQYYQSRIKCLLSVPKTQTPLVTSKSPHTIPSSALCFIFLLDIRNPCFTENHGFDFFGKCPDFHLSSPIMRFKTAKYDFRIQHDFLSRRVSLNIVFVGKSMKYSCPKWRRLKNQPLITFFQLIHSKM